MAKLKSKKSGRTYIDSISNDIRKGDDYFVLHRKGEVQVAYKKRKKEDKDVVLLNFKNFIHHSIIIKKTRLVSMPVKKDDKGKKRGDDIARRVTSRTFIRHIPVNPEFIDYIFHMPGSSVKFLMYALGFLVDYETNTFRYNDMVYDKYNRYCQQMSASESVDISKRSMYNSIRELVAFNIIVNVTRGTYMVNPLVACMGDSGRLATQIKAYAQHLMNVDRDVESGLVPFIPIL